MRSFISTDRWASRSRPFCWRAPLRSRSAGSVVTLGTLHAIDLATGIVGVGKGVAFQAETPVAMEGDGYRELARYLRDDREPGEVYSVSGSTRLSVCLLADVPGSSLLANSTSLRLYLTRNQDPSLLEKQSFIEAVDQARRDRRIDQKALQDIRDLHSLTTPLVVITLESRSRERGGAAFQDGRFRVFELP